MYHPNPSSDRPALIEDLTVWGWAVQHRGIPLDYAAAVLAPATSSTRECPTPPNRVAHVGRRGPDCSTRRISRIVLAIHTLLTCDYSG
ncbi:hypothetical protein GCM10010280_67180 [Streptomyces pilosus]|uniref:Uncharacterized protein n=1 Tax=Streptomyces pilosus TaxID=28893 RepID=A0A918C7R0_9ACTN|nr:hypothetical protein GCM10010280_67180 [Streptomyces pilosus]